MGFINDVFEHFFNTNISSPTKYAEAVLLTTEEQLNIPIAEVIFVEPINENIKYNEPSAPPIELKYNEPSAPPIELKYNDHNSYFYTRHNFKQSTHIERKPIKGSKKIKRRSKKESKKKKGSKKMSKKRSKKYKTK